MTKDISKDVVGQTEDGLQQKCVFWFHNAYPDLRGLLFSVPNGGLRSAREGRKMKLTGQVSGVSDLIFMYAGKTYLLELKKTEKDKQRPGQVKWQTLVEGQGFEYTVVYSLAQFKSLILNMIGW